MDERKKSETISVSVPQDMYRWLEDNNVNRSRIFQAATYKLMNPQPKVIPLQTTLMCIMAIIAGICITLIFSVAAIQIIIGVPFSAAMMVLGIALAVSSLLTFKKARKETQMM